MVQTVDQHRVVQIRVKGVVGAALPADQEILAPSAKVLENEMPCFPVALFVVIEEIGRKFGGV